MTDPVSKYDGTPMSVFIRQVSNELPVDAVCMGQIVSPGISEYGLSGMNLDEFVARCVSALIAAGAIPVIGGKGTDYAWIAQHQYGNTSEDIVTNIIDAWHKLEKPFDGFELAGWVWFARPDPRLPNYIKFD